MPCAQAPTNSDDTDAQPLSAEEIARRYTEDRWSLLACAQAAGVSEPTARKMLARQGVTIRKPGGPPRARRRDVKAAGRRLSIGRRIDPARRLEAAELHDRINEKIRADARQLRAQAQRLLDEAVELEDLLAPVTAGRP